MKKKLSLHISMFILIISFFFLNYYSSNSQVKRENDTLMFENKSLRVSLNIKSGQISVLEKSGNRLWEQPQFHTDFSKMNVRNLQLLKKPQTGLSYEADFLNTQGKSSPVKVTLSLTENLSELKVEADMDDRNVPVKDIKFLKSFLLKSENGVVVVPTGGNGFLYPILRKDIPRTQWSTSGMDMPWIGMCDMVGGYGYIMIVETPCDGRISLDIYTDGPNEIVAPGITWLPEMKKFGYPRSVIFGFSGQGNFVALAKRYREYATRKGLLVTLSEKSKKNPNVTRLYGSPIVWGSISLQLAREAKKAGIERMLMCGHSLPHNDSLAAINDLGFLSSMYNVYQDVYDNSNIITSRAGRIPEDIVLRDDSTRMRAWVRWDGTFAMKRCPALRVPAMNLVIPEVKKEHSHLNGIFIDVTTSEDLYECYDSNHPVNRSQMRQFGIGQFELVKSLGFFTGGEHGRWWAVPYADYFEGLMSGGFTSWPAGHLIRPDSTKQKFTNVSGYKYPSWSEYEKWGIGHAVRVPLWELVFHDCVLTTWYWGDSNDFLLKAAPEMTQKKDAFNILYGTLPMMWSNRQGGWQQARDAFIRTWRNTCKLHEAIAGTEMISHEFVTPDRAVQKTKFSDGTEVIVNFGDIPFKALMAGKNYLLPKNGFAVKGPKIEQALSIINGKNVTIIKTDHYYYSDEKK